jgi:hypothetical protein
MSYKPEVKTAGDVAWVGNTLRFETEREAEHYVIDLAFRWTAVKDYRVVTSDDPVNYTWNDETGAAPIPRAVDASAPALIVP